MTERSTRDLGSRPMTFLLSWGIPFLIMVAADAAQRIIPYEAVAASFGGAFAWMGISCLINAARCGRRHCFLSGPVFLVGATAILLAGFGVISLGRQGVPYIIWATIGLFFLTFIPEWIWGRYVK